MEGIVPALRCSAKERLYKRLRECRTCGSERDT